MKWMLSRIVLLASAGCGMVMAVPAVDQQKVDPVLVETKDLAGKVYAGETVAFPEGSLLYLQHAPGERLYLSVDESFDSGLDAKVMPLREGTPAQAAQMNGGKSFASLGGWGEKSEVRWHVYLPQAGKATVKLECAVAAQDELPSMKLTLGSKTYELTTDGKGTEVAFTGPGLHQLTLTAASLPKGAQFKAMVLEGKALKGAAVARARWRPGAAHGRFQLPDEKGFQPEIWVVEQEGMASTESCYAPITTPFGYFGSSRTPQGHARGMNFSLWSFGRGQQEPELKTLSHLLAIGSAKGKFSGFSHEGTGVKVRGWDPFEGSTSRVQRYAVRKQDAGEYWIWSGYFWDFDQQGWHLFGKAKQWKGRKKGEGFGVGTFVEVPGPPHRQRSGDVKRECRYRAWAIDSNNKVLAATHLAGEKGPANRWRYTTQEGQVALGMGGVLHYPAFAAVQIRPQEKFPVFLQEKHLGELRQQPCSVTLAGKTDQGEVTFKLHGKGDAVLTLYYGEQDALSFAERWQHSSRHEVKLDGASELKLPLPEGAKFYRALLETPEGKAWMEERAEQE
ncbi:hypothetical protein Rhal01_02140 [Rubritalea halochordaticola]|uniref:Uncharacterized protein n=1 Tax=Rubritalea halochordaticola TaxID=714537 RepID=A0ABP9UZT7_9BACT